MDNKSGDKVKDGMSVQELETFGKKHLAEIVLCLMFLVAMLFSWFLWGFGFSVFACGVGGILGVWLHSKVNSILDTLFGFVAKQEKITKIVISVALILVSAFLPPLVFLGIGLMAGQLSYSYLMRMR